MLHFSQNHTYTTGEKFGIFGKHNGICNVQKKKIYIGIYRNVSFLIFRLKFPPASMVYNTTWWIYENSVGIQ